MARARNIKPGFFYNEELAECDPLTRILFIGLWCIADRCGRLDDRPKRIRAELIPYDNCDVNDMLDQLQKHGFILRYASGENRYIQVLNFKKHQNPHIKEAESTIPEPCLTGAEEVENGTNTMQAQCKHSASTMQEPEEHGTSPADSGFRIPDSGFAGSSSSGNFTISGANDAEPLPPIPEPSEPVKRIGLICRLLRSQGINVAPGQFQGKYAGLENNTDDDFHLAVQSLKDRGESRIGIGLVAAVLGDMAEQRKQPAYNHANGVKPGGRYPEKFDPSRYVRDAAYRDSWDFEHKPLTGDEHGAVIDSSCERLA